MSRERVAQSSAGLAAMLTAVTVFSWGAIIVKGLGLPIAAIAFWRILIAAGVLSGAALLLRTPWPKTPGLVLLAGLCFGVHLLLFVAATVTTTIAVVMLMAAIQPLLVSFVSRRAVGERVPWALRGWALVAVFGVAIVVHANLGEESRSLLGDVLSVLSLCVYTTFFLVCKQARLQGTSTLALTAGSQAVALVIVAPAFAFFAPEVPSTGLSWGLLVLLAMGPGNGHLLVNWAHPRVSATLASLTIAAVPLLTGIWAHLVFGEPYGPRHVAGMLLVAVAIEAGRRAEARSG